MRILIDTNIILDVLLRRAPFFQDSSRIWQASDDGLIDASIAAFSIPTIHYICRRHAGRAAADAAVDLCLEAFEVAPLYRECIMAARQNAGQDFEDDLQAATAITDFSQGIVTRNPQHFPNSRIAIYTPSDLLSVIKG